MRGYTVVQVVVGFAVGDIITTKMTSLCVSFGVCTHELLSFPPGLAGGMRAATCSA